MVSSFDLSKLRTLLQDFYNLSHIRITVFDDAFHELVAYPENIASICQLIRTDAKGREECQRCDKQACKIAAGRHSPYTYLCHAGLTESITPLYMGNIIIGYLFFGHVFSYPSHEEGWTQIETLCKPYHLDMQALRESCMQQPLIPEDYIASASHLLQAVASYLCLERIASLRHQELPVQIDDFITANLSQKINAITLCHHFGIGKTQLYEIANQSYGMGIAQHIRKMRIKKAKQMLQNTKMPLAEIATECGFNDYNYFITAFKHTEGITPMLYRKNI